MRSGRLAPAGGGPRRCSSSGPEHLPRDLVAHRIVGAASCAEHPLLERASQERRPLDAARIGCPERIVWGGSDRLLPRPAASAASSPTPTWFVLEGVGHCAKLDAPLEAAQLVIGFIARCRPHGRSDGERLLRLVGGFCRFLLAVVPRLE